MLVRGAGNALAAALVDELARHGVRHAVFSPGSRSTPLVVALDAHSEINLHVSIDERSAGFVALGLARGTGLPTIVLTTSGSAAANLYPAIVEADHSRLPMIVLTADRPPELRDTGAGQTIDQIKMFGDSVRWFCEVGVAETGESLVSYSRSVASRAFAEAAGFPRGPVQLNMAFREPFLPTEQDDQVDVSGRDGGRPWTGVESPVQLTAELDRLTERIGSTEKGLLIVGAGEFDPQAVEAFARASGWPVVAEAHSSCRTGDHAIASYDALLRVPEFAGAHIPDLVLRLGSVGTSRKLSEFLNGPIEQVLVDREGRWADPSRSVSRIIQADPSAALQEIAKGVTSRDDSRWLRDWQDADSAAQTAIDETLGQIGMCEPMAARVLTQTMPGESVLLVASSMPVRDVDWFMRPRPDIQVHANRGTNGIDGFTSTAAGLGLTGARTFGLCGDLAFLHDVGGMLTARMNDVTATLVVLNNNGGGIFGFLPQSGLGDSFRRLFATPHGLDLEAVAKAFGCDYTLCDSSEELRLFVETPSTGGLRVAEVRTNLESNVTAHQHIWDGVAEALTKER